MAKKKEPTFEENLQGLENIIARMEQGEIPLEELMKNYADGMALAKKCRQTLDEAEKALDLTVSEDTEPQPLFLEE